MKSEEIKQNIKLGMFVLAGLVLFLATVFLIGSENNIFSKTFVTHAIFKNVEGLKEGDNVWLSGVKIGTVKEVRIVKEGHVVVALSLKENQNKFIKKDATASIGSDGLVGNKIVVIRPGVASQILEDSDTLGALSPADTQELINIARDVGDNTRSLTSDLKVLAKRINDGQGIVGELLNDGAFAQDLRTTAEQLRLTTYQTAKASGELQNLFRTLNEGDGLLHMLATDTSIAYTFSKTMANVNKVSQNTEAVSKGLEDLVDKLNSDQSAIGVLLADTAFADKLKVTLDNAESASAKLDENMEALQHNFLFRGYFRKKARSEEKANK
ncbi:MAG TPA: MlaD family protein [Ohtaekwangia sp.]|nr:MlaD family protein [Ohtaekwangia sp.]